MIEASEMADANAKGNGPSNSKEYGDEYKTRTAVRALGRLTLNLCNLLTNGLEVCLSIALHLLSEMPQLGPIGMGLRAVDPEQGEAGEHHNKGDADHREERSFGSNPVLRLDETSVRWFEKYCQSG